MEIREAINAINIFSIFIDRIKYNPYIPYILRLGLGNKHRIWSIYRHPLLLPYDYFFLIYEDINGKLHIQDQPLSFKELIEGIYETVVETDINWMSEEIRRNFREKYPKAFEAFDNKKKIYICAKKRVSADRRYFKIDKDGYFYIELVYDTRNLKSDEKVDIIIQAVDNLRKIYEEILGVDYKTEIKQIHGGLDKSLSMLFELKKLINTVKLVIKNINDEYTIDKISIHNDLDKSTIRIYLRKIGDFKKSFYAWIYRDKSESKYSLSLYVSNQDYNKTLSILKNIFGSKRVTLRDYRERKEVSAHKDNINTLNDAANMIIDVIKRI